MADDMKAIMDLVFPNATSEKRDNIVTHTNIGGLTKREYFATMAMQSILSNKSFYADIDGRDIVIDAIHLADILIEKLKEE